MDEGLDMDILMQVLDGIAQIDLPASKKTLERKEFGKILLPHLAKLYDQTNWNRPGKNIPLFCMDCMNSICDHIDKCKDGSSHGSDKLEVMINGIIASDKINEMLKNISESYDDSIVVLWDTFDLSNFYNEISQFREQCSLFGSN